MKEGRNGMSKDFQKNNRSEPAGKKRNSANYSPSAYRSKLTASGVGEAGGHSARLQIEIDPGSFRISFPTTEMTTK